MDLVSERSIKNTHAKKNLTECLNDFNIQILTNVLQLSTALLVLTTALISKNGMSLKIVKNGHGSRFRKKESIHEQT